MYFSAKKEDKRQKWMNAFKLGEIFNLLYTCACTYYYYQTKQAYNIIHTYMHAAALKNGNVLSKFYHDGAYGLLVNPPRWSCCKNELREAKGCISCHTSSQTLPHGSEFPIQDLFSDDELSDPDEESASYDDNECLQSMASAPGKLFPIE